MHSFLVLHLLHSRHDITLNYLLPLRKFQWLHLITSQEDMGAIQVMGISWSAFHHLVEGSRVLQALH